MTITFTYEEWAELCTDNKLSVTVLNPRDVHITTCPADRNMTMLECKGAVTDAIIPLHCAFTLGGKS